MLACSLSEHFPNHDTSLLIMFYSMSVVLGWRQMKKESISVDCHISLYLLSPLNTWQTPLVSKARCDFWLIMRRPRSLFPTMSHWPLIALPYYNMMLFSHGLRSKPGLNLCSLGSGKFCILNKYFSVSVFVCLFITGFLFVTLAVLEFRRSDWS